MKYILYLFFLISSNNSFCQNEKHKIIKIDAVSIAADLFIGFDGYGNYFYVKNNVVYKQGETSTFQYQNLYLGKISKIDILNPLKIIIFYEEFNAVIVLDNQLNEIQKIEFSKLETPSLATAIGISGQNKLWVFNNLNQQIGLYDLNLNTYENKSISISESIVYYQTDFNYFQWIDKQNNWFTSSIFGRIVNNGKVEITSDLQLLPQNKILFSKDNKLFLRDCNINKLDEIEIVEKSFINFYYKEQILSIFTENGITNYKLTIP